MFAMNSFLRKTSEALAPLSQPACGCWREAAPAMAPAHAIFPTTPLKSRPREAPQRAPLGIRIPL